jgi:N-acetyl-anhydromuramyl-L-alanine amidase AmpD
MIGERGWMPATTQIRTSYYGYSDVEAGGMNPTAIVNHIAQGFTRTIDRWAREGLRVTPHFAVTRDGAIFQYVSIFDAAYHAGRLDPGAPPTWRGYQERRNPNKYTVGIEFEGFSVPPAYGYDYVYSSAAPWPEPMVEAGIRVHRWIFDQVEAMEPSPRSVIGHSEIAPRSRRHDPGDLWPQERIIAMCRRAASAAGPVSRELTLGEALASVAAAFPGDSGRVALTPRPEEDGALVYELRIHKP